MSAKSGSTGGFARVRIWPKVDSIAGTVSLGRCVAAMNFRRRCRCLDSREWIDDCVLMHRAPLALRAQPLRIDNVMIGRTVPLNKGTRVGERCFYSKNHLEKCHA